jgi:C-terminal processing protease CtpA/Prc
VSARAQAAAFVAGAVTATAVGALALPPRSADRYRTLDTFAQTLAYVANNYVDQTDERRLLHGAARGLVGTLDQHSAFLPPDRYRRLRQDTEGEFGGVGLTLGPGMTDGAITEPWPFVDEVVAGSPAEAAGLAVDDRVVAIGGEPTTAGGKERKDAGAWEAALRGASGTRLAVTIFRPGWPRPREFSLVRAQVKMPSVERLGVEAGIGYVAVGRFAESTAADVGAALTALRGGGHLGALILDLRTNPGGLLDQGRGGGRPVPRRGRHRHHPRPAGRHRGARRPQAGHVDRLPHLRAGRRWHRVGGRDRRRRAAGWTPRPDRRRHHVRQGLGPDVLRPAGWIGPQADHRAVLHPCR